MKPLSSLEEMLNDSDSDVHLYGHDSHDDSDGEGDFIL